MYIEYTPSPYGSNYRIFFHTYEYSFLWSPINLFFLPYISLASLDEHITIQLVEFMQTIRYQENLMRIPGISETLDWAMALAELEVEVITSDIVKRSLPTIVKEPEDLELLKGETIERILANINKGQDT